MTGVNIILGHCEECDQEALVAEFGVMQVVTEGNCTPVHVCKSCMIAAIEKMKNFE